MTGIHPAVAAYESVVDSYDRGRPDYPNDAIAALRDALGTAGDDRERLGSIVDLGAGTGKLTAHLIGLASLVVAVEPVAGFRDRLIAARPTVGVVAAVAADLPFAASSLDAVVAGQAFHWFATTDVVAEIHRVLTPRGRLALVWNVRVASSPAHRAADDLLTPLHDRAPTYAAGTWRQAFEGALFEPPTVRSVRWDRTVDRRTFLDRYASVSVVAALPDPQRTRLLDEFGRVFDRHARGGTVTVGYRTDVWSASPVR